MNITPRNISEVPGGGRRVLVTSSSTGISDNFRGNEFKFSTRGFLVSLIMNITSKYVSDVPGRCCAVVKTSYVGIIYNFYKNTFSGFLIKNINVKTYSTCFCRSISRITSEVYSLYLLAVPFT